jgi:hypothetical protein
MYNNTHEPKLRGCTDPNVIFNFTERKDKERERSRSKDNARIEQMFSP